MVESPWSPSSQGRCVAPVLGDDQRVGVLRLGRDTDGPQQLRAAGRSRRPAASRRRRRAASAGRRRPGPVIRSTTSGCLVERRDGVEASPAVVVGVVATRGRRRARGRLARTRRPEGEPGAVRRVGRLAGADLGVSAVPVEPGRVGRDVVEHAVEDHLDAPGVRPRDERLEVRLGAQVGVDGEVVGRVVAVVGGRREDGVQVQRGDAPRRQVVEMRGDAGQVAAEEVAAQRPLVAGRRPGTPGSSPRGAGPRP